MGVVALAWTVLNLFPLDPCHQRRLSQNGVPGDVIFEWYSSLNSLSSETDTLILEEVPFPRTSADPESTAVKPFVDIVLNHYKKSKRSLRLGVKLIEEQ